MHADASDAIRLLDENCTPTNVLWPSRLRIGATKEAIKAFRTLLRGCEEQWRYATQQDSESSESEAGSYVPTIISCNDGAMAEEDLEDGISDQAAALLCDDC